MANRSFRGRQDYDRKKGAKIKANAINDFIGAIRTEVTIKGRGR